MSGEMSNIRKAGRTFYFAALWLPKHVRLHAARAYDFCRAVDDLADTTPAPADRDQRLLAIAAGLRNADCSVECVSPLIPLINSFPQIQEPLAALVDACREDLPGLVINDEADLERYAFGVAGNVGLVMYPILGGASPLGQSYAADLGIAMQYTNISRDIFEDQSRGRTYLPRSWLAADRLSHLRGLQCEVADLTVQAARKILSLADIRYARGLSGLHYLASDCRFGIEVAAQCYRAIGERVITNNALSRSRAVVPFFHKARIACSVALTRTRQCERLEQ
jgi:phytoene synthase